MKIVVLDVLDILKWACIGAEILIQRNGYLLLFTNEDYAFSDYLSLLSFIEEKVLSSKSFLEFKDLFTVT